MAEEGIPAVPVPVETNPLRAISFAASSQIAAIEYNESEMALYVTFQRSGQYVYWNVPVSVADGFRDAPSAGKYLNAFIKGLYDYEFLG